MSRDNTNRINHNLITSFDAVRLGNPVIIYNIPGEWEKRRHLTVIT